MFRTAPKYVKKAENAVYFTESTELLSLKPHLQKALKGYAEPVNNAGKSIKTIKAEPITPEIVTLLEKSSGLSFTENAAGFVIINNGDAITVYADTDEGVQNGIMTFLQSLSPEAAFEDEIVWDYPICSLRGVKIMMPARSETESFKRFIDTMVYFRHNTLMLEIGGAMEYKKHPEINEGWEEYCTFMSEYSGKSKKIQEFTYPWRKNSIHCNNGGGSYLTQDEIKELIAYCEERSIKIIPEVPCTSHCDYLLTRHPELAERCEDPFPDTFCPSNPDSYKLLFDVFDEVIDVFKPEIINIGHDEYYSINVCDRCRKRIISNSDLLAEDINRIHDYLKSKSVKTMLWCDKLMNVEGGAGHGGALTYVYFAWNPANELLGIIKPTWEARNKIPKDIICMNWYMSFGEQYDEQIREFPVVFGNFWGQFNFKNFRKRIGNNTMGGMCSNWGAVEDVYFCRNNIYSAMAYNDVYYWDAGYDDNSDTEYALRMDRVFESLYAYRYNEILKKPHIEVVHTTDRNVRYKEFVDGIFPEGEDFRKQYLMGHYEIKYTDGTVRNEEIFYGDSIINEGIMWYAAGSETNSEKVDAVPGATNLRINQTLSSVAGKTLPMYIDGKIYCKYIIPEKYPEKKIAEIKFVLPENADWHVEVLTAESV